jgi:hypothetical protein
MKIVALLAAGMGLVMTEAAWGQERSGGLIGAGDAVFAVGDYPEERSGTGPQSVLSLSGPAGVNHVQMSHWWYRINQRLRESALSGARSWSYDGGESSAGFALAQGVPARLQNVLERTGAGGVRLTQMLTVTNETAGPLEMTLFSLARFTLGGGRGSAVSVDTPRMMRLEAGGWTATYSGREAQGYEVGGAERLLGLLTDHDRFDLSSEPLGGRGVWVADTGGAFSWSFVLGPGESRTVATEIRLVPGPGGLGLLGAGWVTMGGRRRSTSVRLTQ